MRYAELEPFGPLEGHKQAARVCAAVANFRAFRGKDSRVYGDKDFMPKFGAKVKVDPRPQWKRDRDAMLAWVNRVKLRQQQQQQQAAPPQPPA